MLHHSARQNIAFFQGENHSGVNGRITQKNTTRASVLVPPSVAIKFVDHLMFLSSIAGQWSLDNFGDVPLRQRTGVRRMPITGKLRSATRTWFASAQISFLA